jgi:hypothetical protein
MNTARTVVAGSVTMKRQTSLIDVGVAPPYVKLRKQLSH